MFGPHYTYYGPSKKHWLRDAIGTLIRRIIMIAYQIIPVLIILNLCGVITIDLWILVACWVSYQILDFIGDIVDHFIEKHDEEEQRKYYDSIKQAHIFEPPEYVAEDWRDGVDPGFHDLKEGE